MSQFPPSSQFPPPGGGPGFPPPAGGPGMGPLAPAGGQMPAGGKSKKGKKDGDAPTKGAVRKNKIYALIFALIAVLLVVVVVTRKAPETYVVQAHVAVGADQPLSASDLQATPMPAGAIESGTFTGSSGSAAINKALKAIGSAQTRYPLFVGEQLHSELFSSETENLSGSQRLMSIKADPAAAVDGAIRPGDSVDIIAVSKGADLAGYVATNVPVISVGPSASALQNDTAPASSSAPASAATAKSPIPGTYVIKVDQSQVTALAIASNSADALYLTLRGPNATDVQALTPLSLEKALCGTTAAAGGPTTCTTLGK